MESIEDKTETNVENIRAAWDVFYYAYEVENKNPEYKIEKIKEIFKPKDPSFEKYIRDSAGDFAYLTYLEGSLSEKLKQEFSPPEFDMDGFYENP